MTVETARLAASAIERPHGRKYVEDGAFQTVLLVHLIYKSEQLACGGFVRAVIPILDTF